MDRNTELALVRRLREGDAAAFDVIHDAFNARLFAFLLRLSRSRDVAEDLLEEMWLRLVTHATRLHPDTRLGPWLFTVARNLHVSHQRARVLKPAAGASLWPFSVARESPFEATAAGEFERRLERALASLPARSREVLLLVGVEGLDHAQAAGICGVTPETLRQRLHRARAMLARALEEQVAVTTAAPKTVTP